MAENDMKIGYLIPQFPSQTHIFFWREMQAIQQLSIKPEVVSTRRPPPEEICHEWASQAIDQTEYLTPVKWHELAIGLIAVFGAGPFRWLQCVRVILTAQGATAVQRLRMLGLLILAGRLIRLVRKHDWKHLHVHSCAQSAMLALFANLLADIPYSLTLHGTLRMYGPAQHAKWRHAQFGVTVTCGLRDEVLKELPDLPADRVVVAPMGVDMFVFQRSKPYGQRQRDGVWQLVTCGRLHHGKGHQDVIRAVAELRRQGVPVRLTILGEGAERLKLQNLIAKLNLDDVVVLTGAVSERRVRDELESAHLFVLGSHDEAIPVAIMEAMAMGLPVVVTNVGGVHELVRHGVDGLLVRSQDVPHIVEAIHKILQNPQEAQRMGISGCDRVRKHFNNHVSAQVIAQQLASSTALSTRCPQDVEGYGK